MLVATTRRFKLPARHLEHALHNCAPQVMCRMQPDKTAYINCFVKDLSLSSRIAYYTFGRGRGKLGRSVVVQGSSRTR